MPGGAGACRGGEEGWGDGETERRGSSWFSLAEPAWGTPASPVTREEARECSPRRSRKPRFWRPALGVIVPKSPIEWGESSFSRDQNNSSVFGDGDLENTNEPTEEYI